MAGLVERIMCHIGFMGAVGIKKKHLEAEVLAARSRFFEVGREVRLQSKELSLVNLQTASHAGSVAHAVEGVAEALGRRRREMIDDG